ncbi:MAG TPA: MmcQ/YjbR family DNA-binding protein [Actinomycetota bacterium]|nr:MmcQ/YjbR family DNA-binding protein [Actinomycetota bacterium]
MATQGDVRRIALALPDVVEEDDRFAFSVRTRGKLRGIAWVWLERTEPGRARTPNLTVLAVRVADAGEKEMLLEADPAIFFTEPHYDGYLAVLVRLAAIGVDELEELITDAWRSRAPRALVRAFDEARDPGER